MKHILVILVLALFVPTLQAETVVAQGTSSRRQEMLQRYARKSAVKQVLTAEQFLEVARKGDTDAIASVTQLDFFKQTDKFSNNCFHLAKDAATVQALAAAIRRLDNNFQAEIKRLRNQRNDMGETPLLAHINYGKADTFALLYEGSDLAEAVREVRLVDKGGALSVTASIKKGIARSLSQDISGRTVAQAALANMEQPGMASVVEYFQIHAPYLF